MLRRFDRHDVVDLRWAHDMVAKGAKAVAILQTDLICEPAEVEGYLELAVQHLHGVNRRITACYLDLLKEPERLGREFTGGDLLRPCIGAVETGRNSYSVFFAANETMRDLFEWAFRMIKSGPAENKDRAHAILGLLCGYSPMAIEGFLKQPLAD
jgi:hypothetical protein